jgi:hypothetical protein
LWGLVKAWLANPRAPQFNRGAILLEPIFRPGGQWPGD